MASPALPTAGSVFWRLLLFVAFVSATQQQGGVKTAAAADSDAAATNRFTSLLTIGYASCNKHDRAQDYWRTLHRTLTDKAGFQRSAAGTAAAVSQNATTIEITMTEETKPPQGKLPVFAWLGDVIYADTRHGPLFWEPSPLDVVQAKYIAQRTNAIYADFVANKAATVIGVWDDHDMNMNDGGKEYKDKAAVQQYFLDFLDVAKDDTAKGRRGLHGVYNSYNLPFTALLPSNPLRRSAALSDKYAFAMCVILLDVRSHRDRPHPRGEGDVLGDEQWKWLEQELRDGDGDATKPSEKCLVTLVGSGIQVLADEKPTENWGVWPQARDRLINTIRRSGRKHVVLLSGDVHMGEILHVNDPRYMGYPIVEATSSGLTHSLGEFLPAFLLDLIIPTPRRVGRFYQRNFGSVSLVVAKKEEKEEKDEEVTQEPPLRLEDLQLHLGVHDVNTGDVVVEMLVPLKDLEPQEGTAAAPGHLPGVKTGLLHLFVALRNNILPEANLHIVIHVVIILFVIALVVACDVIFTRVLRIPRRVLLLLMLPGTMLTLENPIPRFFCIFEAVLCLVMILLARKW